jgi:hypothetical protein
VIVDADLDLVLLDVGHTVADDDFVRVVLGRWSRRVLRAARERLLGDIDNEHVPWNNETAGVLNAAIEASAGQLDQSPEADEESLRRVRRMLGHRVDR